MKMSAIVLFVLAGLVALLGLVGVLKDILQPSVEAPTGRYILYVLVRRTMAQGTPAVLCAGLGACCLGIDKLLKKKAPVAKAAPSASTMGPARPASAIRPAGAEPRPDRQNTPGQ